MTTMTARLSVMMFLQFFIWGGWFVTLGTFLSSNLGASGGQIGMAFSTQSWGAIIAPFVIGLIADRYFNAERILAVLHLIGAVLLLQLYRAPDFSGFYPFVLAYMMIYMPTLALVNRWRSGRCAIRPWSSRGSECGAPSAGSWRAW